MAARDVADRIGHRHDRQAEGERDAEQADADLGEPRGDDGAAATREGEPEGADALGDASVDVVTVMEVHGLLVCWKQPIGSGATSTKLSIKSGSSGARVQRRDFNVCEQHTPCDGGCKELYDCPVRGQFQGFSPRHSGEILICLKGQRC
jgi:hypothetical protein